MSMRYVLVAHWLLLAGAIESSTAAAATAVPATAARSAVAGDVQPARDTAIVSDAALPSGVRVHAAAPVSAGLVDAITRADAALFDAVFDHCDAARVRAIVTDDFEFHHDRGGLVASSGADFAKAIARQCQSRHRGEEAQSRRELVPGTLQVYPVGDVGAIETGVHRFYERGKDGRETLVGAARFLHVWRNDHGVWRVARVASFDHYGVEAQGEAAAIDSRHPRDAKN